MNTTTRTSSPLQHFVTIAIILLLATTARAATLFTVNQSPVFVHSTSGMLLASVPQQWFGSTVTATITGVDAQVLSIDGTPLPPGGEFTFENISASKSWQVTCSSEHNGNCTYSLQFTFLPIVALQGDIGYDYAASTVTLAEPGLPLGEVMKANIRWRGQSTNTPDKHKRNYNIKLVDDSGNKLNRSLLGMRRDNHWILDAAQADMARVRNRVATELWLDMAHEPYYYNQAPDALTGVRGKMVELFLGNDYRGIYSLTEAIDRKQLQLVKHDTINNVFHGGLWKTNKFNEASGFRWAEQFNDSLPEYCNFETKYPELDEVFPTSYQVLYDAINAIAWAETVEEFNNVAGNYIDMPVAIDYTIFYLTLNASDNSAKNIHWLVYDRAVDPRLSIAVWDLDATAGGSWSPSEWRPPITAHDYFKQPYNWVFKMLFHNRCIYRQQFLDRYDQLRATWLSEQSLVQRYTTAIDRLIACGAATREQDRWNGDTDLYGHPLDLASERDYIVQWFKQRLPLLDVWMHHHLCDVNNDGHVTAADITVIYNHLLADDAAPYTDLLDTNFDGHITAVDITAIYNHLLDD